MEQIIPKSNEITINVQQVIADVEAGKFPHLEVKILAHSTICGYAKHQIATFEVFVPRCILAEINTHRVFSRNTGSTRAIPTKRSIQNIKDAPFIPFYFGENKAGMQSKTLMGVSKAFVAKTIWNTHRGFTLLCSQALAKLGLHKQWLGRISEPHSYVRQVITSTDFENFFNLRIHDDAQPEIIALAYLMEKALSQSTPRFLDPGNIRHSENWHLPYITDEELEAYPKQPNLLAKLSTARCARTSYKTQEGAIPSHKRDLATYDKLVNSDPIHGSCLEHIAYPKLHIQSRNFTHFKQFRELYEEDILKHKA